MKHAAGTKAVKPYFLVTASAAALALGAGLLARHRSRRADREDRAVGASSEAASEQTHALARNVIQYFVIPLWTAAGVADWWCHRASNIEETTGLKESLIHVSMLSEAGICVVTGLLLEINAPILGLMVGSFFLHEATAMWDVSYAVTAREVTPIEQHVHSFLEMVPLMAVAFVSLLHWPQAQALVGRRVEPLAPLIQRKKQPLTLPYVVGVMTSLLLLEALPMLRNCYATGGRIQAGWSRPRQRLVRPHDRALGPRSASHRFGRRLDRCAGFRGTGRGSGAERRYRSIRRGLCSMGRAGSRSWISARPAAGFAPRQLFSDRSRLAEAYLRPVAPDA